MKVTFNLTTKQKCMHLEISHLSLLDQLKFIYRSLTNKLALFLMTYKFRRMCGVGDYNVHINNLVTKLEILLTHGL